MSTIVPKWLRNMSTHEFAGKIIHHEIFISCFPRSKMWNCELQGVSGALGLDTQAYA